MAMLDASAKRGDRGGPEGQAAVQPEADAKLLAEIDRDRLIWDPEYRAEVSRALERQGRPAAR